MNNTDTVLDPLTTDSANQPDSKEQAILSELESLAAADAQADGDSGADDDLDGDDLAGDDDPQTEAEILSGADSDDAPMGEVNNENDLP